MATSDVAVLIPNFEMSSNIGIYVATMLRKEGETKYSYGRKWDVGSLENTELPLPIKGDSVDWEVVDAFIGGIKSRYKVMR